MGLLAYAAVASPETAYSTGVKTLAGNHEMLQLTLYTLPGCAPCARQKQILKEVSHLYEVQEVVGPVNGIHLYPTIRIDRKGVARYWGDGVHSKDKLETLYKEIINGRR